MPFLTVLAGPNGSGKSTLTGKLGFEGQENLLDPDAIAKRIDPSNPSRAAVAAGREAILRTREYLRSGTSFGIETTLSGGGYLETMKVARDRGFVVRLVYICVGNPEKNVQRARAIRAGRARRTGRGHPASLRAKSGQSSDGFETGERGLAL